MKKLDEILFYTLEKSIKTYRKFAQTRIAAMGYDITIDQWLVLKTLYENKRLSQSQLATRVFKDVASITRILDLLVKKKYIKRNPNLSDGRKSELEITRRGISIIANIYPIIIENRKQALRGLKKNEIAIVKLYLEKITNNCK